MHSNIVNLAQGESQIPCNWRFFTVWTTREFPEKAVEIPEYWEEKNCCYQSELQPKISALDFSVSSNHSIMHPSLSEIMIIVTG